jgi:hypothetical protein
MVSLGEVFDFTELDMAPNEDTYAKLGRAFIF